VFNDEIQGELSENILYTAYYAEFRNCANNLKIIALTSSRSSSRWYLLQWPL